MITLIEALGFRSLRYVSQRLDEFHVLVGPNASGKTTFFDAVSFLGDLVSDGIEDAVRARTSNFYDLTWRRQGAPIELAVEARIPEQVRQHLHHPDFDTIRYETALGVDPTSEEIRFQAETVRLVTAFETDGPKQLPHFPSTAIGPPSTILHGNRGRKSQITLGKGANGSYEFYSETSREKGKGWIPSFRLGPKRSALANLPEDETRFPATSWLKTLLVDGLHHLVLNSLLIRQASPPGQGRTFRPDGSNLPWVVHDLERQHPERIADWVAHLQTALPDLETIRTIERPDDRHRYLMLRYRGGIEVPSWVVSDGTLRLLALTLPAYLPELSGIYLIEEPENGIHPRAVETMFQSLSSVYDAQILLATHSPVILGLVEPEQLLCFAKDQAGATDIVLGSDHPALREWRERTSLGDLFASGVLGYGS